MSSDRENCNGSRKEIILRLESYIRLEKGMLDFCLYMCIGFKQADTGLGGVQLSCRAQA
jgi:hypothetical protein